MLDINEPLRYLGVGKDAPDRLREETAAIAAELERSVQPRYLYKLHRLEHQDGQILLPELGLSLPGQTARRMLEQCDQAVLLSCTLGPQFDALLRARQARDMSQAVILDACGSAWVEHGCDLAEQEIASRFPGRFLTDRFSPGYGDLPLELQPALCAALDAPRRLGVHVTDSFLLNPCKSVTALIGLSDRPQQARIRGCAYCSMRETCALRKGGKHCAN